ncbi:MAG: VWA domain-containing protein [Planctomycetes bacterium]|nr:VWA domain-containing protein [Planctomycetota bacterium]
MPELTFADPERWWWFGLLPVLFVLLLPPRPRRVSLTAHLPQWRLALEGLKRKPPRALSLRTVLLLLAASCAVLAAMGLSLRGRPGPSRLVVALDASASMAAVTARGETAWAEAKAKLREVLPALPEHVAVTLLRCGGPALRRHGASARALHDLGAPMGSKAVDLARLAHEVVIGERPDDEHGEVVVWTLTDGQGQRSLPTEGALSLFGERAMNATVLAVRVVDHWPLPQLELEADVVAFTPAATSLEVALTGAVAGVEPHRVRLLPGEPQTVRWSVERTTVGGPIAIAVALAGDALPADDHWTAVLPPLPAPRIAVLAAEESGPFASVAAEALAAEVGGEVVPAAAGAEVGLLLVDGGEVAIEPGATRALCFGSRFRGSGDPEPWPRVGALDWDRVGTLTAGLDLSELRVDQVDDATLPVGEPFLFGERAGRRAPLAVVAGGAELASVHFGFQLRDSNLALLAAFPQLLRRAFVRCYGTAAAITVTSGPPAAGEQDLWRRPVGADRPLPAFGTPDTGLGAWLMLVGLMALALRAWLR